jgi:environmental stress-induced protein Ves
VPEGNGLTVAALGERARAATTVRLEEIARQPWRNGGGKTRELLVRPDGQAWRIRISVADVDADAPFSSFPGVQRWFAVLEGAGVELTIDGRPVQATGQTAPIHFPGTATVTCRLLDGPTLDLNLMLRGVPGRMHVAANGVAWRPELAQCGLYAQVGGRCLVDGATTEVPPRSLVWFDVAPAMLSFAAEVASSPWVGCWLEAGEKARVA